MLFDIAEKNGIFLCSGIDLPAWSEDGADVGSCASKIFMDWSRVKWD